MKLPGMAAFAAVLWLFCGNTFAAIPTNSPTASVVSFPARQLVLNAYLYKPEGPGPHPVIVWNHGSPNPILQSGAVSRFNALAQFCIERGFILFIPDRRARNVAFADAEGSDQEESATKRHAIKELLDENHSDFRD